MYQILHSITCICAEHQSAPSTRLVSGALLYFVTPKQTGVTAGRVVTGCVTETDPWKPASRLGTSRYVTAVRAPQTGGTLAETWVRVLAGR